MTRILLCFGIITLILSCSKKEPEFPVPMHTPVITGFIFRDLYGNVTGETGIPNSKLNDPEIITENIEFRLGVFPVPCYDRFRIEIATPGEKKIWIVPANLSPGLNNHFNSIVKNLSATPVFTLITYDNTIMVDIPETEHLYYRIYVEIQGVLLWAHMIIDNSTS